MGLFRKSKKSTHSDLASNPSVADVIFKPYQFDDEITGFFGSRRDAGPGGTGRFGLRILGEKGAIDVLTGHLPAAYLLEDPLWSPGRSGKQWVPISSAGPGKPEPLEDRGLSGGNQLACQDLLLAIEEDRQPEANVYEARTTVEMISAIFDSHRQGMPVTIPLASRDHGLTQLTP